MSERTPEPLKQRQRKKERKKGTDGEKILGVGVGNKNTKKRTKGRRTKFSFHFPRAYRQQHSVSRTKKQEWRLLLDELLPGMFVRSFVRSFLTCLKRGRIELARGRASGRDQRASCPISSSSWLASFFSFRPRLFRSLARSIGGSAGWLATYAFHIPQRRAC